MFLAVLLLTGAYKPSFYAYPRSSQALSSRLAEMG